MSPFEVSPAYLLAVLLVVLSPGPDNILAISRGLSQGWPGAMASSVGAGLGIVFHTVAAVLGLTLVLQSSPTAFWIVKGLGGVYLLYLGTKAICFGKLVSFSPDAQQPLWRVFGLGLASNVLNPKPGLFVLAFIPQFVSESQGSLPVQMVVHGAVFAVLTAAVFTLLGALAHPLAACLSRRPAVVRGVNLGAGLAFLAAAASVLMLERRH